VPGLTDPGEIATVAAAVPAPLNVLAQPHLSVHRLAELGVRRIRLAGHAVDPTPGERR